ncbi:hypothetical protein HPULCUR_012017 [Helicostylum pulchrum]|uniref:Uncharacterized protein n=1 Tax=Helicostylum pulchrum TaxID=562976 RepID=A0ABP9YHZ9_9FUNG
MHSKALNDINKIKKFKSNQKAADSLRSELDGFHNETANEWKRQWERTKELYLNQNLPETNNSSASGSLANNGETNTTNFTITNNTVPSTSDESTVQPTQCLVVYKGYVINPTVYDENSIGDNDGANGYLKKFNQFQKVAAAKSSSSDFSVESNIQHIMALNNTLLVKPD